MTDERPAVVGIRFRNAGRISYYDPAGMRLEPGDFVVVETAGGPQLGKVVIGTEQVVVNEVGDDLPPVLRLATDDDVQRANALQERAVEHLPELRSLATAAGLDMHIAEAQFSLDGSRLAVSVAVEQKVDWRQFVRDVSRKFRVRVEMRSMGSRDRAKLAGGYGICGRELCCSSWLTTFPAISIRMAKNQDRPLNPQKISGLCGRLLCCLSYEDEVYKEMRQTLPKIGQRCSTPTGEGKVIGVNTIRREVTIDVDRNRVVVGDKELGTVVRWDPRARNAPPPPSIPAEVEESPDGPEPVAQPSRQQARMAPQRGDAARRPVEERPTREPRGRQQPARRAEPPAPAAPERPVRARRFERKAGPQPPAGDAPGPAQPRPGSKAAQPPAPGGRGRPRRRGRRGGGSQGDA